MDDFAFLARAGSRTHRTETYLSRGENKTLIIGLKFLLVQFLEGVSDKRPIVLLDDFFSELDTRHSRIILEKLSGYRLFITTQLSEALLCDIPDAEMLRLGQ